MSTVTDKRDILGELTAQKQALSISLPTSKTEEYRFTPVVRVLEKSFPKGFIGGEKKEIKSIEEYLIPGLDAALLVVIDGVYSKEFSNIGKEEAVSTTSSNDPFAVMNAAWSKGAISINKSDKPVLVLNLNTGSVPSVHNRITVKVEDGASISIIQKSINISSSPVFQTLSEEISVGESARFDLYKIQNSANLIEVGNTSINQVNSSHVNTFTLMLDGTLVRNNLTISIDGENCESHFHGLSLLKGETIGDNHTVVDHLKPNSVSNELYKGVMDDKSKGVFNGKIFVRPHAQKTNAFQSNRNILLTDQATINTKPQLEIWADDVKCSHGCTTGQLDDEALFYLQSRGIGKEDARAMLLYAFAMQTTELIANAPLKAHIDSLISKRLYEGQ
ncbi:MAG TPA: Fe-S cluster assembly protein SufD [Cyclobacteriaceae bacterium]|nr:Fe-S cluster assembly protein SufD [Cyclobacteriaceae bacterium]